MSGGSGSQQSQSNPQLNPQGMVDLYLKSLPQITQATAAQAPTVANSIAQGVASAAPTYSQTGLDQLNQFAPGYQAAGQQLATTQATNTNALLQGAGGNAASSAVNLNNTLNPTQGATNKSAGDLLGAINLNGLSPGEWNSTERSVNQGNAATGNLGLNNGMNTVANAMNFGGAFNSKIPLLDNAINTASGVATAQNNQVNPLSAAVGASNTSNNFGLGTFNPTQANANSATPFSFSSSLGSTLGGVSSAPISSSGGGQWNAGCCFIMLEAHHGHMPFYVRECRDKYYSLYPQIAKGYVKMASWLVPLMRTSFVVRNLVWYLMVAPLTEHGAFVKRIEHTPHRLTRKFWFSVWHLMGRNNER